MTTDAADNRRDSRRAMVLRVEFPEQTLAPASTSDISSGGLRIHGRGPRTGSVVRLRLSFPGLLEPMDVVGNVVWSGGALDGGDWGVRVWSELDRRRLSRLAGLVAEPIRVPTAQAFRVLIVESDAAAALEHELTVDGLSAPEASSFVVDVARDWREAVGFLEHRSYEMLISHVRKPGDEGALILDYVAQSPEFAEIVVVAVGDEAALAAPGVCGRANVTFASHVLLERVLGSISALQTGAMKKQARIAYV